ncbi:MAG: hypothetical protein KGJ13_12715 [Patescibacteria group bacterium]|nr:hypothetical protein [Patescibacteria group bacterium]
MESGITPAAGRCVSRSPHGTAAVRKGLNSPKAGASAGYAKGIKAEGATARSPFMPRKLGISVFGWPTFITSQVGVSAEGLGMIEWKISAPIVLTVTG